MSDATTASRSERALLALLVAFTAAAIAGFAIYAMHPERLGGVRDGAAAYGLAMALFPRGHIVLGFLAIAVVLARHAGWRWLPALGALYATSLASELLGTTVGLPFGPYHYTPGLGPQWFSHVPILIPLSWFTMATASFALTRGWLGARGTALTIAVASLVLAAWDLVLDPAMSRLTPYWIWGAEGPYFGMPLLNLVGWYETGLVLMGILVALRAGEWVDALPSSALRSLAVVYAANLALPMGLAIAGGMGAAALTAAAVLAATYGVARLLRPRLAPAMVGR
jgi:putative membrane protein